MLYPIDVLIWTHGLSEFGIRANDPLQFFAIVEMMNCLAGAACLAILCFLLHLVTESWFIALMVTAGYGFSGPFIAQATNANEPMVGVFWSFLAILLAAMSLRAKSLWPVMVSGFLFSLGMATYQSTILLAPAALFLVSQTQSRRWHRVVAFTVCGVAGGISIFGWAYWHLGIRSIPAMFRHFVVHEEGRAFMGVTVGKVLTVPIGMANSVFPILAYLDFRGLRGLLAARSLSSTALIVLPIALLMFLVFFIVQAFRTRGNLHPFARMGLLAATIGFAFVFVPLIVWVPTYDKLWIEPLACLAVLVGIALSSIPRASKKQFLLSRIVSILVLIGPLWNLALVARYHSQGTPEMDSAHRLEEMIGSKDLLIGDWDNLSTLYSSIWVDDRPTRDSDLYRSVWADNEHFFSLTTAAAIYGIDVMPRLQDAVARAESRGGNIFFLNLLDQSRPSWDAFFDKRCGVPYSQMQFYRDHSMVRAKFPLRGGEVVLRKFKQP